MTRPKNCHRCLAFVVLVRHCDSKWWDRYRADRLPFCTNNLVVGASFHSMRSNAGGPTVAGDAEELGSTRCALRLACRTRPTLNRKFGIQRACIEFLRRFGGVTTKL